jgi:osmotically-inducible protein OsmY
MRVSRTLLAAAFAAASIAVLPACTTDGQHRSVGQTTEDTTLLARVKTALIQSPEVKANDVNVDVRNGVVQLKGRVATSTERAAAERVARGVSGVRSVQNDLQIGS